MDNERFIGFIEEMIEDGEWEYRGGDSMTEDAKAFLELHKLLKRLWDAVSEATLREYKMKAWLKKFFKGIYVGCCMLIIVGVVFIVLRVVVMVTMICGALLGRVEPTINNIIIVICICFVIAIGFMWSASEP